ncbi:hypothetical protein R1T16_17405 [Flavobacterium sp. DG1-102-2]|uniref:hypothetical protein n=1 Tax=Flavobacterium sp. DG1-102-2 TaxID=3081663 RepID=UPI002949A9BB|nr:hypothetical protein [Flavobacterium sp. DG1-102-2]MDV6170217.1 hypothetical protein [Flavobacterium sp. DG1-102-2]
MKKLLLLTLLLSGMFCQGQDVSPYYPAKNKVSDPYDFTSQLTYFDMNYISNNISEFLTYRMNMGVSKTDDSKLMHDGGVYTVHYTDKISQSGNQSLTISYNVVKVTDIYTIQSVKITGSPDRVISFFVEFWQTSMNFEAPKGKSDVSLLTGQDVVKFYFNKGKPYIDVTNNTFKTVAEFEKYYKNLKISN